MSDTIDKEEESAKDSDVLAGDLTVKSRFDKVSDEEAAEQINMYLDNQDRSSG